MSALMNTHTDVCLSDSLDRASAEESRFRDLRARSISMSLKIQAAAGECFYCVDCGNEIPSARRRAVPGARRCVQCQENSETISH